MFIGTMVIELCEFNDKKKKKKKNMDKMGKLFLLITLTKNGILVSIQLCFDMYCAVKSLKVRITLSKN